MNWTHVAAIRMPAEALIRCHEHKYERNSTISFGVHERCPFMMIYYFQSQFDSPARSTAITHTKKWVNRTREREDKTGSKAWVWLLLDYTVERRECRRGLRAVSLASYSSKKTETSRTSFSLTAPPLRNHFYGEVFRTGLLFFFSTGPYGLNHMVHIAKGGAGLDLRISLHPPVGECMVVILVQGQ